MTWKVTYRRSDGKQAYEIIEADNRGSLFNALKEKNISAIRVDQVTSKDFKCKSNRTLIKPVLIAVALIAVSLVVMLILSRKDSENGKSYEMKRRIAERTPSAVGKPALAVTNPPPTPVIKKDRPTKIGEVVNGYVMLPSGRIHRRVGVVTNSIAGRPKGKYAIFSRSCNNEIACYLTMKPGTMIIGSIQHDGRFKRDFLESLKETIEITPEDTEEQAQLKRDVIEARQFLKDAMDRGEDIEKIMQETRQELQDFMRVRIEHQKLFREQLKNCETDKDVEDLFGACNKMLEEKGIAPLTYGPITRRNLLRQKSNEQF